MKTNVNLIAIGTALLLTTTAWAGGLSDITGKYVEIRSCDVYTGSCFANGEMGLTGEEAILTWAIDHGSWDGIALDNLNVVAVVRASATLGDTSHSPYPAKAVLILDQRADTRQRQALARFARHMGGRLLENITTIDATVIDVDLMPDSCSKSGCSTVKAEGFVEIRTRCLGGKDHVCGNEETYYPPLTQVDNARPAFTTVGRFDGPGLGVKFDEAGRRSAYLATFSQRSQPGKDTVGLPALVVQR